MPQETPPTLTESALDILFRRTRSHNVWTDRPVSVELLRQVWDLTRMGPTSANCLPARIVFAVSAEAKEKLMPCLMEGNREKTMSAPAAAIIGYDLKFHDRLAKLFPHEDARSWFAGNPGLIQATAFRNGTLQGAYFMLAARALGLDCGPMSGFDNAMVDEAFFTGSPVKSDFICNVGYGDPSALFPRSPRLDFDDACKVI